MDKELLRLADELSLLHEKLGTWEKVGAHYGLPKITLWRIVNDGYEPKNNRTRQILGLSEIIVQRRLRDAKGRFAESKK